MKIITTLLMWLMLFMGGAQVALAQDYHAMLPSMDELQQEAIDLKRKMLTATKDQREVLAEEADRVLALFDRRITALRESMEERQDEMSETGARYADELMSSLRDQRDDVQQRLQTLGENLGDSSADAWGHAVYNFSTTYDSFVETWEDVESNFPLESL